MSQVQSGILPEHCRAAIWIEANVKGEVDALRAASKTFADKLATFEAKFPDAHLGAVVAFGNNTWRALSGGVGAEELKDFPGYGKGLAPTTQFDVLIHILSLRHDVNFSVAQAAMEAFGDCIEVKEEIHGFRWVEERDLSGFVDGTENPAGEETRREVAVIKDGVDAGGSYVFVQRWEHNLKQLNRMSVHDQEMMIGRTKEANEEIDGDERPETSHLTRVDLNRYSSTRERAQYRSVPSSKMTYTYESPNCEKPGHLSTYHHHAVRAWRKNRAWFFHPLSLENGFKCFYRQIVSPKFLSSLWSRKAIDSIVFHYIQFISS